MTNAPFVNKDPTSLRQRNALGAANIDPRVCVWWNASPYHLGYKGAILDTDRARGARYLREFVDLCPDLKVVVAMGPPAHPVCAQVWQEANKKLPPLIRTWHPMIYGRGWAERQARLLDDLREASRLIRG